MTLVSLLLGDGHTISDHILLWMRQSMVCYFLLYFIGLLLGETFINSLDRCYVTGSLSKKELPMLKAVLQASLKENHWKACINSSGLIVSMLKGEILL